MENHIITDKDIIYLSGKIKKVSPQYIMSNHPEVYDYVVNRYDDSESFRESWCRILHSIEERPTCKVCGAKVKFIGFIPTPKEKLFSIGCCNKHRQLCPETINKAKGTFFTKYGVSNPNKLKSVRDKIKNTCLVRYGVDHNWKSEESKEKAKKTCLQKYGVEYSFQSENNKEKAKKTWLKKYGVDHPCKSKIVQEKFDHTGQVEKMIETKRKNKTFSTSQVEEEAYIILEEKYGQENVLRQYKSDEYPFACDFYVKSEDLYVEIQGNWTHGKHAYNKDSMEDQNKLSLWKTRSKDHPYYINAIKTWTIRDVKKREIAKKNNLNFKEFWSILDLQNWLENG